MQHIQRTILAIGMILTTGWPAAAQATDAQNPGVPPRTVVEGAIGWAGFGDERLVHHTLLGASARYYLTRRLSIGPELQYMAGPGSDRDTILTANLVVDLLAPTASRPRRTTPYLVLGGGVFRHSQNDFGRAFSSTEGAFTAGLGVRGWVSTRVFVGADARIGWEPHVRLAGVVGVAF